MKTSPPTELRFEVPGVPCGKPAWARSQKSFAARKRALPWLNAVRRAGREAVALVAGEAPLWPPAVPLVLEVTYWLPRPRSHYRTGRFAGELKPGSPAVPTPKPDLTNLTKALEDCLAGVVYRDDAQVVDHVTRKRYADHRDPCAVVLVTEFVEDLDPVL